MRFLRTLPWLVSLALLAVPGLAVSAEPATKTAGGSRILVLDFGASLGADPELARLMQEMFVARLQSIGGYSVVASSDLQRLLDVEQQKQMLGCNQSACLVEVAGALGARYVVSGGLSLLAGHVLTLKLVDATEAKLANQIAKTLSSDRGELAEGMRLATYELFGLQAPLPPTPWYSRWWVWTAGAAVIAAGAATTYALTRPAGLPSSHLGKVVVDAK